MMISGQNPIGGTSLSTLAGKTPRPAANGSAPSSAGTAGTAGAGAAKKDFASVADDARATLDAAYRQRGEALNNRSPGSEWETVFAGLDRRALYAVASNAGGQFSKEEQGAADFLMGKQLERAQGLDADNPAAFAAHLGNPSAGMKAGIRFLDTVSDEEKQSVNWAVSRASMQHSYELLAERDGQEVENLDSDNPLVKAIKAALSAAKGDPARERSEGRTDTLEGLKSQPWAKGFESRIDEAFRAGSHQGSLFDHKV